MKSLWKKLSAAAVAAVMAVSAVATASAVTADETNSIDNGLIQVVSTGERFYLTTGSDYTKLLYFTDLGTSRVYAQVDGDVGVIGSRSSLYVDQAAKKITTSSTQGGVDFTRDLTIVSNSATGREDLLEVKVTAVNNDTTSHDAGVRIMLDTMLGDNDSAPFRVPGVGAVTTNMQFEGDEIATVYQAFDDLTNPTVVSTGTFLNGSGRPDIVQYNNYGVSANDVLVPGISIGARMGDSSVNAIWQARTLAAGESLSYRIYYGLSQIDLSQDTDLVLGATQNPKNFSVNEAGTGYDPVSIISYVQNNGSVDLSNVKVSIALPEGVSLVSGNSTVSYDSLAIGDINQQSFKLNAEPSNTERTVTVTINAESAETGAVTPVTYTYTIPAIEGAAEPATEPTTEEPATVEPTTEQPTTIADATSATQPTTAKATPSQATKSEATSSNNNGTVKTGEMIPAFAILAVIVSACGAAYFARRKRNA